MTTFFTRIVVAASAIVLTATPAAFAAQAPKPTDLLTPQQVKELVATAKEPADHVKLQKHFLAVAAKYDAEAAEHADLAQTYRKPPVGRLMPGSYAKRAQHCDRLAASLREAGKDARELAKDHEGMAASK